MSLGTELIEIMHREDVYHLIDELDGGMQMARAGLIPATGILKSLKRLTMVIESNERYRKTVESRCI